MKRILVILALIAALFVPASASGVTQTFCGRPFSAHTWTVRTNEYGNPVTFRDRDIIFDFTLKPECYIDIYLRASYQSATNGQFQWENESAQRYPQQRLSQLGVNVIATRPVLAEVRTRDGKQILAAILVMPDGTVYP